MKLSEAIRLGAMVDRQAFYQMVDGGGTCAIGGALKAVGILDALLALQDASLSVEQQRARNKAYIAERFPHWIPLMDAPSTCPECRRDMPYLAAAHLNDTHKWTRERIADWVETIENAQPVAPPLAKVRA